MTEVFGILLSVLKFTMCLVLGTWLAGRMSGISGFLGILVAWLFLQAAQLGGIYFLSAFDWLAPGPYRIWVALQCVFIFGFLAKRNEWRHWRSIETFPFNLPNTTALIFIIGISCLLFIRALFFYDTAYDSFVYGLPRLAFFLQSHSVFAIEPGMLSRIFCNEWNAELNAMHYGLLLGSDTGFMLAGVEVWWLAFLSATIFALSLRAAPSLAIWVGLLIATTPAVLNLSGVTKGDLLAMVAMLGALSTLLQFRDAGKLYSGVVVAGLFLAFGAGCKGTMVPVFAVFCLCFGSWVLISKSLKKVIPSFWYALTAILISALFLGRHIANLFVFGNPLQRVPFESETGFNIANMMPSIANQFIYVFGFSEDKPWQLGYRLVETRDFAVTGWLFFLCAITCLVLLSRDFKTKLTIHRYIFNSSTQEKGENWVLAFFLVGSVFAWILLCGMMPLAKYPDWRIFQLRFFLWFIVPIAVFVFVFVLSSLRCKNMGLYCLVVATAAVAVNMRFGFQPSEILGASKGFKHVFQEIARGEFHKKLSGPHFTEKDLGPLKNKMAQRQKILLAMFRGPSAVYNGNLPIFPFFGNDLEWRLDFAATGWQFAKNLQAGSYDWVVFCQDREAYLQENLNEELAGTEYELVHTGRWAQIYGKRNEQR